MTLETQSMAIFQEILEKLDEGFQHLPDFTTAVNVDTLRAVLFEVAEKMQDNYPYQHPLYAGQMLKPPHPVARLAYMLSLWINPNNHALDGGRASSAMEKEAVANIAAMFGWERYLGHLSSGGTMANLEALWVADRLHPGDKIVASDQAHYTHGRISDVLQIPFQSVPSDSQGRMNLKALKRLLKGEDVGTIVATLGTTAAGAVDPLPDILELAEQYGVRVHVDAAYGGYFTLADNLTDEARAAFDCISDADSIVVDPHKHGLQPYGCGCIIFKDPSVGKLYKHDSPYTYFSSAELHLGEISLECSRAGASAVALWATQKLLPMVKGGEFAQGLQQGRNAALTLFEKLEQDDRVMTAFPPELDIVIWAPRGTRASEISQRSKALFEAAAREDLHLAVASFPQSMLKSTWNKILWDQDSVSCVRSCLMKPEHHNWMEQIWQRLEQAMESIGS